VSSTSRCLVRAPNIVYSSASVSKSLRATNCVVATLWSQILATDSWPRLATTLSLTSSHFRFVCLFCLTSQVNFCWPSPPESFLVSGPLGTHVHIFVPSQLLRVLKCDILFEETRGLTVTGRSIYNEQWLCWLSFSFTHSLTELVSNQRVRVTLRLAVYRQLVRLGAKLLEIHDHRNFFVCN
jgi:hypothetical protein